MIGSVAFRSTKKKIISIITTVVNKPIITVEFHAYSLPPSSKANIKQTILITSVIAPAQSIFVF